MHHIQTQIFFWDAPRDYRLSFLLLCRVWDLEFFSAFSSCGRPRRHRCHCFVAISFRLMLVASLLTSLHSQLLLLFRKQFCKSTNSHLGSVLAVKNYPQGICAMSHTVTLCVRYFTENFTLYLHTSTSYHKA